MIGDRLQVEHMGQILRNRDQLIKDIRKEYIKQFRPVPDDVMQQATDLGISRDDLYQNVHVAPSLAKRVEKHGLKHHLRPVSKRMSLEYTLKKLGLKHLLWDAKKRGHIGAAVQSAVVEGTDDTVFEIWQKAGYVVAADGKKRRVLRDVWGFSSGYISWLKKKQTNKLKNWMTHDKVHTEYIPGRWADGNGPYSDESRLNERTPIIRGIGNRRRMSSTGT